jgi:hypothetical protein
MEVQQWMIQAGFAPARIQGARCTPRRTIKAARPASQKTLNQKKYPVAFSIWWIIRMQERDIPSKISRSWYRCGNAEMPMQAQQTYTKQIKTQNHTAARILRSFSKLEGVLMLSRPLQVAGRK